MANIFIRISLRFNNNFILFMYFCFYFSCNLSLFLRWTKIVKIKYVCSKCSSTRCLLFFSLRLLQARAEDIVKSRMQWKRKRRTTVDKTDWLVDTFDNASSKNQTRKSVLPRKDNISSEVQSRFSALLSPWYDNAELSHFPKWRTWLPKGSQCHCAFLLNWEEKI